MTRSAHETTEPTILLLAAGEASRMRGGDKLLEEIDGVPLLRKLTKDARSVADNVMVCLREEDNLRRSVLDDLNCRFVAVPDASKGMAHSLRAGVAELSTTTTAVMVVPADMPDITRADLAKMLRSHQDQPEAILRASTKDQQAGHPVLFPKRLFGALEKLSGDVGAREVLRRHANEILRVQLPGTNALTDLDTPEDWLEWRQNRLKEKGP
ncbi:MAG: nucleotidyltransferase family protein [Shimia sp.]|uniref:nucleotidyltransferase family protein n=1 Tax=Shimia sp. TaxID=1954381 RepID=UPI001B2E1D34|nr:nucleotidyltransferase family protein [Shimia sp.]MBO6897309.1 nucleotidyltransferase family protein [Shimia sp.]